MSNGEKLIIEIGGDIPVDLIEKAPRYLVSPDGKSRVITGDEDTHLGSCLSLMDQIQRAHSRTEIALSRPDCDIKETLVRVNQGTIQGLNDDIPKVANTDFLRRLVSGSVQIVFCINSSGGAYGGFMNCKHISDFISSRGGAVSTFGGSRIISAAAEIFLLGDGKNNRHCLSTSDLLFHMGADIRTLNKIRLGIPLDEYDSPEIKTAFDRGGVPAVLEFYGGEDMNELIEVEWQELIDYILSRIEDPVKQELFSRIVISAAIANEKLKPDREMYFKKYSYIVFLGLANAYLKANFLARFQQEVGISHLSELPDGLRGFLDIIDKPSN